MRAVVEVLRRACATPAFLRWLVGAAVAGVALLGLDLPEDVATALVLALLGVLGVLDHRDTVAAAEGAVRAAIPDMSADITTDGER